MGTMTTRRTVIFLLCVAVVAFALLGCQDWDGDQDARNQWQSEVNSRQRGLERPTPTAERTEQ